MTDDERSRVTPEDVAPTPAVDWGPPSAPAVPWAAPKTPAVPNLTVGVALRDVFARYAADPVPLFLLGLVQGVLSVLLVDASGGSTAGIAIVGLFVTAAMMALVDRQPGRVGLTDAVRQAGRRVPWLLLTELVIGFLVLGAVFVPAMLVVLSAGSPIAGLAVLVGLVIGAWVIVRLVLALPGVVLDDLRPNPALSQARRLAKGTSLRILGILVVVGLLDFGPGAGIGAVRVLGLVPQLALLIGGSLAAALVSPLATIALVVLYRDLGGRPAPAPVGAAATLTMTLAAGAGPAGAHPGSADARLSVADAVDGDRSAVATDASPEPFATRGVAAVFGTRARALFAACLVVGIGGVSLFAWSIAQAASGNAPMPNGSVPRGQIEFGSANDLAQCSVANSATTFATTDEVAWVATFGHRTAAGDTVGLLVVKDKSDVANDSQTVGVGDCIGSPQPLTGLAAGSYEFTITVNGMRSASGTFSVH